MKHLPNLLTLGNLMCGCIAISFILGAQNFTTSFNATDFIEVPSIEQPYWGSVFILIAAVCDLLDGWTARGLKVFSPIGKDLDSLADIVSFGVAPSMILFKMLWAAFMVEPGALDVNMLAMAPAFLVACFAALRLAKFNITASQQSQSFIGMPVPAVGLFVASFPLISLYNPFGMANYFYNYWVLYLIIAVLCWLMVSKVRFFKLMPVKWPQVTLIVVALATLAFLRLAAIPVIFAVYIILSFVYKPKELKSIVS